MAEITFEFDIGNCQCATLSSLPAKSYLVTISGSGELCTRNISVADYPVITNLSAGSHGRNFRKSHWSEALA